MGFYGRLLLVLLLVGWGMALIWGPLLPPASVVPGIHANNNPLFTFLRTLAANIWLLALFRLLAGVDIGGEWSMGASPP